MMKLITMLRVLLFGHKKIGDFIDIINFIYNNGGTGIIHKDFIINRENEIVGIRNFLSERYPKTYSRFQAQRDILHRRF